MDGAARELAEGTLVAGRYRILSLLGRGGMGAVYRAEHVNTGGVVALKVMLEREGLSQEMAGRFRREARASARITSEHVVRVTDADTAPELGGAPFLVMELLDGEDLERILERRGRLPPGETLDVLGQVARALDRAHASGVVHRDLKPENVFEHRREDGSKVVKVLDFGISKVLRPEDDLAAASVTSSNVVMGTPLYMSPEQANAHHDLVGPGTDVWAVGLLAVRMLTGRVYWEADTLAQVMAQILATERAPPSSRFSYLGPRFDAWFAKSCAPHPEDRFATVGEQIAALRALEDELVAGLAGRGAARSVPPPGGTQRIVTPTPTPRPTPAAHASTNGGVARSVAPPSPWRGRAALGGVLAAACAAVLVVARRPAAEPTNVAGLVATAPTPATVPPAPPPHGPPADVPAAATTTEPTAAAPAGAAPASGAAATALAATSASPPSSSPASASAASASAASTRRDAGAARAAPTTDLFDTPK